MEKSLPCLPFAWAGQLVLSVKLSLSVWGWDGWSEELEPEGLSQFPSSPQVYNPNTTVGPHCQSLEKA